MRVIIAGGGLAGLAAAAALSQRGVPCTLLESRTRLGGRASSFLDPTTGEYVDNCQHVSLGCCTNFRHFCEAAGLSSSFRREKTLYFVAPSGRIDRFEATGLPAPLHLAKAFARLSSLSWKDKFLLGLGLRSLARGVTAADRTGSFQDWLIRHRQTPAAITRFWHVVLVSALSESLDRIDVEHARKVFVDTFLSHRDAWTVEIPRAPLEHLYGVTLRNWLVDHGCDIQMQSSADRFEIAEGQIRQVTLSSGATITGDEFICALPFHRVSAVLPEPLVADYPVLSMLQTAPISSIHLWFDRPITDLPHAVLVDRLGQWMFNRTVLSDASGQRQASDGYYYQIVISASRELESRPREDVLAAVLAELAAIWPDASQALLLHSRQVTEHRAVFSPTPGVDAIRPPQQTRVPNLQLAGDWTRTGWPATMEGAVRSGYLAAENVLRRLGRPETVVQPDLPVARLSRWLMGVPASAASDPNRPVPSAEAPGDR